MNSKYAETIEKLEDITEELLKGKDSEELIKYSDLLYNIAVSMVNDEYESKHGIKEIRKSLELARKCITTAIEIIYPVGIWKLDEMCKIVKTENDLLNKYFQILKLEGRYVLDSFALYIEKDRPPEERFYLPRRKTLIKVVNMLQKLEDDELDEMFLHQPARTGKSQMITIGMAWHCARDPEASNLYITYKEGLGGAFLTGVMEIWTDPTYLFKDVFPEIFIPRDGTDAKNHKVSLIKKRKYATLSGKGLESGLNGEYDAYGWLVLDDILEGIQDVLNPDVLRRKQIVFNNNVMSRKKKKCKIIYNGTIWSLHDIYMNRLDFLENNPAAKNIRYEILKIPALDPVTDESNFDYDYDLGFSTEDYRIIRAKFEDDEDMAGWFAQYQQEPIEREGAVFSPETMHFYNGVLPKEGLYRITLACDVALGGEDFLCMPIAYMYEDGSIYIHDVIFDNSEKDVTKPRVCSKIVENECGSGFFEANQGGEGYKDEVASELEKIGYSLNLTSAYAPTNKRKEQRIWDKAPSIRKMYFRDNGCRDAEYRKFMNNLFSFTVQGSKKHKHEDAADALATLCYYLEGSWGSAKVEVVKNPMRYGIGAYEYYG